MHQPVIPDTLKRENRGVGVSVLQGLGRVVACYAKEVAKKIVKCTAGWNFRKYAAVIKDSYGLAPPDPPVPSAGS